MAQNPVNSPLQPPPGATVITSVIGSITVTETFVPITYSQYASLRTVATITSVNSQGVTVTDVVGPGGVAWAPLSVPTAGPQIEPTDAPYQTGTGNRPASTARATTALPPGATVVTTTVGTGVVSETFIPTTYSQFLTLASTISSFYTDNAGSTVPFEIGPGGVAWTPLATQPTGMPEIPPPTNLPSHATRPLPETGSEQTGGLSMGTVAPKTTAKGGITGGILPVITTAFDVQAAIVTSIDPTITGNTAISTGDGTHPWALYPFIHGGPHCLWCPPGLEHGGIVLWGITKPGVSSLRCSNDMFVGRLIISLQEYDDIEPPIPSIVGPMPDIVVDGDLTPSAKENPDDQRPSNAQQRKTDEPTQTEPTTTRGSTARPSEQSTGSCSATVVPDCEVVCSNQSTSKSCSTTCTSSTITCSGHGTTVTSVQTGACERPSPYSTTLAPVQEPSKGLGKGSIALPSGGRTSVLTRTGTAASGSGTARPNTRSLTHSPELPAPTTARAGASTARGGRNTNTGIGPNSSPASGSRAALTLITSRRAAASTTHYVPPAWECPNDGVRQNAAGCPTPTTSTGGPLRCSTGSNLGVATYDPQTWCGCNDKIYSTISGATSDYCAYQTPPASTIDPTQVPNPFPFTTTNSQNGEVVACATSSVDTSKSTTACDGKSTIVSTVTSIAVAASASAAAAVPTANCDFWDEVLYWTFEVYNINGWAGDEGNLLKTQEKGCGGLTGWNWPTSNDNARLQHVYFNLPLTMKSGCVERAIKSAGGPGGLSCKGHGLKKRNAELLDEGTANNKNLRSRRYGKRLEHQFSHQYLAKKAMEVESQDITGPSLVSRAHSAAWTKYAPKGVQYYNEWKNRGADQDDKAALCNFDQTYDFSVDPLPVTEPMDPIKPYINGAEGQTYTNFRWHWPKGPTNQATAIFWNNISPVDNAIIAFSNDRGGDEEGDEDKSPDNWSDMVWWLWLRATTQGGEASGLQQIFRYNVDNPDSRDILEEVVGTKQDEIVTLEPDDARSQDNGFWALLGCPNGTGMIHLVGDHKKALNGKGIKSISCVYNRREDQYYMWGNLG